MVSSIGEARTINTKATADRKRENDALEQQNNNYKAKTDASTEATTKAIDKKRAQVHQAGSELAHRINGSFQSAKANTGRSGDYGKMSSMDVALDLAARAGKTVYNGAVEGTRMGAKGVYSVGKALVKADTGMTATVAKKAVEAYGGLKKMAKGTVTGAKQAYNTAANAVGNFGRACSGAWNSFTSALAL